mmetsp:Transcript_124297/g.346016  ORF Transcript_124297/g.346016 Transcript_124297/m.346016 type:complete len:200 (+) Transcript_124297:380-979(+)
MVWTRSCGCALVAAKSSFASERANLSSRFTRCSRRRSLPRPLPRKCPRGTPHGCGSWDRPWRSMRSASVQWRTPRGDLRQLRWTQCTWKPALRNWSGSCSATRMSCGPSPIPLPRPAVERWQPPQCSRTSSDRGRVGTTAARRMTLTPYSVLSNARCRTSHSEQLRSSMSTLWPSRTCVSARMGRNSGWPPHPSGWRQW